MSAASLETSVPVMPMAMPILAVLSAGASLMPSPVMATMWPLRCSALTMLSLCSGSTRANTRTCSTMASSPASPIVRRSMPVTVRMPGSKISSSRAIASAVAGWSPVIITVRMCARLATATATLASARGGSIMPTRPSSTRSSSMLSGSSKPDGRLAVGIDAEIGGRDGARGHRERAQRLAGQRLVARRQFGETLLVERDGLAVFPDISRSLRTALPARPSRRRAGRRGCRDPDAGWCGACVRR